MQSILLRFSTKLNWTSEEASYSQDISGVTPFQMIFEVDEKPRTLMTDSLVIKNFLRKIVMVHPKIRFNFSVRVNGILSTEIFEAENEPTLNLSNGIALVIDSQHYVRREARLSWALAGNSVEELVFSGAPLFHSLRPWNGNREETQTNEASSKEVKGVHMLLMTHLSAILRESHGVVQDSIQVAVDQALEQHHQAAKAHQKLQASLSVAVNSIMSVVTGSTSSSFRNTCLRALQAADTQELGAKLHKSFHEITQHRFLHHCSCEVKQLLPEKNDAESTEDAHENSSLELLAGTSGQVENKRLKKGSLRQVVKDTQDFYSARGPSASEGARHCTESPEASLTPSGSRAGPGRSQEDALWLQEVSNLSEWLSPDP
ncbi:type 2 DNA topoisomerase 6 subunit B-like isoform X1 [Rhinolophus sinicus]|uniref:type 2 DNA topoisomerase 6 subunit B-like isoform X1 n=1 Tax=Rhinolophus sinicus TaxID=89399 RepID=UPI003D7BCC73